MGVNKAKDKIIIVKKERTPKLAFKNSSTASPIKTEIVDARIDAKTVVNKTTIIKYLLDPLNICANIHLRGPLLRAFSKGSFSGENSTNRVVLAISLLFFI
jgi:hypothetical protein